jgi:hypothetical protein
MLVLLAASVAGCGGSGKDRATGGGASAGPALTTGGPVGTPTTPGATPPAAGTATGTATTPSAAAPATAAASDEAQIRSVVTEALTTTDPDACTRLYTDAALGQNTGLHGAAAISECRRDAAQVGATSVAVDRVAAQGGGAEVDIHPTGGDFPFRTATITLVKVGGTTWKVNRIKSGTLDRAAFNRAMGREMGKQLLASRPPLSVAARAGVSGCVVSQLGAMSDGEVVQRMFLQPPPPALLLAPLTVCSLRQGLIQSGAPAALVACITRGLRKDLTTGELSHELTTESAFQELERSGRLTRVGAELAIACRGSAPGVLPGSPGKTGSANPPKVPTV